jgi:hypothetical protein
MDTHILRVLEVFWRQNTLQHLLVYQQEYPYPILLLLFIVLSLVWNGFVGRK